MSRHAEGRVDSRGTVLVASTSTLFMNIVGDMVATCGFTPAFPATAEAAWLSVTRTQPLLVIADCDGSEAAIKRLVVEASARRLPLLMARGQHGETVPHVLLPDGAAWLTLPMEQVAFQAMIDGLLPPAAAAVRRLTLAGAGVRVDAAIAVRTLADAIPDATQRRSIRLLP